MSSSINISRFARANDARPNSLVCTWPELVAMLRGVRRTACTLADCTRNGAKATAEHASIPKCPHKNGPAWTPATFGGWRDLKHVRSVSVTVVDVDHLADDDQLAEVIGRIRRRRYVVHGTHSDRAGDRCVRVVLAQSRPVMPDEWPKFRIGVLAKLGLPGVDSKTHDASRLYYLPSRPSDAEYLFLEHEGEPIDVDAMIAGAPPMPAPERREARPAPTASADELQLARARRYLDRMPPSIQGEDGTGKLWNAANRMVHGFELDDASALRLLVDEFNARCEPPWPEKDLLRAVERARHHCADPSAFRVEDRPLPPTKRAHQSSNTPDPEPAPSDPDPHEQGDDLRAGHPGLEDSGGYRRTDLGNALRFADANRSRLRFVPSSNRWLAWDGQRWRVDNLRSQEVAAKAVVGELWGEAADLAAQQSPWAEGATKWAKASSKCRAIDAMVRLAQSEQMLAVDSSSLDRDEWLLNVANGTLDLRTGTLREHRREDLITRLAPVKFDLNARAPRFEGFLTRMQPDEEARDWIQRYLGYSLTGDVREQCLAFFFGDGANGKSVLLDVVLGLLGEYGLRAAPDLVLASPSDRHPTEVADLDGRRLVVCSEIEQGREWAESTIKRITGDATITARRMRADFYTFAATHKIVIAGNTKPTVRGTDNGIWRRMRLVPWNVIIPDAEKDPTLAKGFIADEGPGIFAWLVRGCIEWRRGGLGTAKAIRSATDTYRASEDTLGRWIDDCCTLEAGEWDPKGELYESYRAWCESEGERPWKRRTWTARMAERRGIDEGTRHNGSVRVLVGLRLNGTPPRKAFGGSKVSP